MSILASEPMMVTASPSRLAAVEGSLENYVADASADPAASVQNLATRLKSGIALRDRIERSLGFSTDRPPVGREVLALVCRVSRFADGRLLRCWRAAVVGQLWRAAETAARAVAEHDGLTFAPSVSKAALGRRAADVLARAVERLDRVDSEAALLARRREVAGLVKRVGKTRLVEVCSAHVSLNPAPEIATLRGRAGEHDRAAAPLNPASSLALHHAAHARLHRESAAALESVDRDKRETLAAALVADALVGSLLAIVALAAVLDKAGSTHGEPCWRLAGDDDDLANLIESELK